MPEHWKPQAAVPERERNAPAGGAQWGSVRSSGVRLQKSVAIQVEEPSQAGGRWVWGGGYVGAGVPPGILGAEVLLESMGLEELAQRGSVDGDHRMPTECVGVERRDFPAVLL